MPNVPKSLSHKEDFRAGSFLDVPSKRPQRNHCGMGIRAGRAGWAGAKSVRFLGDFTAAVMATAPTEENGMRNISFVTKTRRHQKETTSVKDLRTRLAFLHSRLNSLSDPAIRKLIAETEARIKNLGHAV